MGADARGRWGLGAGKVNVDDVDSEVLIVQKAQRFQRGIRVKREYRPPVTKRYAAAMLDKKKPAALHA